MNPHASRLKFQPVITLNKRTFDLDLFELEKINFLNKMDNMQTSINDSQEIGTPTFNRRTEIQENKAKLEDINYSKSKKVLYISSKESKKHITTKTTLLNTQQTTYK
ncbi:unnamed protein product [Paramecium primaurelia]|uniref:Uncharacterized protein n=1 Tax=Paramecium primaurelia TaxID=5886 RepID=A0A8S1MN31_PARPR|nr:unnamed protein product [Paramecium primaurelia]